MFDFINRFLRKIIFFLALATSIFAKAQQPFCDNGTCYQKDACFSNAQLSVQTYKYATVHNVYGSSTVSVDLFITVYSPCALPVSIDSFQNAVPCNNCKRPFILMIHGGGMRGGCRTAMESECREFAVRGYVAATIDYRLGWVTGDDKVVCNYDYCVRDNGECGAFQDDSCKAIYKDSLEFATYRAVQDASAAMRFISHYADNFNIDKNYLYAGGTSAGSIVVINLCYMNQQDWDQLNSRTSAVLGPYNSYGNSFTDAYKIAGLFNNWGSMRDTVFINGDEDKIPMIAFHGIDDFVVPFAKGSPLSCKKVPYGYSFGSGSIYTRLTNLYSNLPVELYASYGGHGIFAGEPLTELKSLYRIQKAVCFFNRVRAGDTSRTSVQIDRNDTQISLEELQAISPVNCFFSNIDTPLINISQINPSCDSKADGSIDLQVEGTGGFLYSWSGPDGFTSSLEDLSDLEAGHYDLTVTVMPGFSIDTFVDITEPPVVARPVINASDAFAFCAGDSITLSTGIYTAYLWSNGDTTSSVAVSTSGSYSVKITDEHGCSANSDTVDVTTHPSPKPVIDADTFAFCPGGSVTLSSGAYASYLWSTGDTVSSFSVNNAGSYFLRVTDERGCPGNSDTVEVTVYPTPSPVIDANGALAFCEGGGVTLDAGAFANYVWSNGDTMSSVNVSTPGFYSVHVIDQNGCPGNSDTVEVIVYSSLSTPVINADGPLVFCEGGSVRLNTGTYAAYLWSNGDTTSSALINTSGSFFVHVTDEQGCSANSDMLEVTVNSLPEKPVITPAGMVNICAGENVSLSANDGYVFYVWSNADSSQHIVVDTAGLYSVTGTNANNCSNTSDAVTVNVLAVAPKPTIIANGPTTDLCPETIVKLTSSPATFYHWSTGATTRSINVKTAGSYTVAASNANECGNTSDSVAVTYKSCLPPTNLKTTSVTVSSAQLNWALSECASNLRLQYRITKGTWQIITLPSTSLSYSLNGLLPATQYQWRIATICQLTPQILSSYSPNKNFTTKAAFDAIALNAENNTRDDNVQSGQLNNNTNISIYPNPAKNIATLQLNPGFKNANVVLTDVMGKVLWQKDNVTECKTNISLQHLSDGTYFVLIVIDGESKMLKLLKAD